MLKLARVQGACEAKEARAKREWEWECKGGSKAVSVVSVIAHLPLIHRRFAEPKEEVVERLILGIV